MTLDQMTTLQPGDPVQYRSPFDNSECLLVVHDFGDGHLKLQGPERQIDFVMAVDPTDDEFWHHCCKPEDIERP